MKIFIGFLISFLVFGWLGLLFSAVGLFYTETVVLSILASLLFGLFHLSLGGLSLIASKERPRQSSLIQSGSRLLRFARNDKSNKLFYFVILVSLAVSLFTCYFATPTIFGGRDQGSIATAAIYLSNNHRLKVASPIAYDLFQKYGAGKALNFPGFDYQKDGTLLTRFPIAYTAYLASAYNLFGLKGIQYANFLPLFFFLVIFWLILKEFFDKKISFLGFLVAATFFPFLWFVKYTLTEIYMLFLVWTGIYFLITRRHSMSTLAAFALSALTRIEGIIFFWLAVLYIFLSSRAKSENLQAQANSKPLPNHADSSKHSKKTKFSQSGNKVFLLAVFAIFLFVVYLYLDFPALFDSAKNFAKIFLPDSTKDSAPSANLYSTLGRIFLNYNIAPYLVFGLIGIAGILYLSWRGKRIRPEISHSSRFDWIARNDNLIVIFLSFPAFFYLASPLITLDDPWLLRRFVFAVFPALIFYTIYFLENFFYHKIFLYTGLAVLIAANSVVSWRFFPISENKDLLPQIEKLSQQFGPDDLILVDRLTTGSGFSLASEPLRTIFKKNAVYFFNADDLKYINQDRYKNIYLVAPLLSEEKNPWYTDLVKNNPPHDAQIITNNFVEPSEKKWALAQNVKVENLIGLWKVK